jgi:hypothetical protein
MSRVAEQTHDLIHSASDTEDEKTVSTEGASEESGDEGEEGIPVDLSKNEIYRGLCTLFEDSEGNNILEYVSLLHTELIGINKSLENLKLIRKDINRLTDCAEIYLKSQGHITEAPKESVRKSRRPTK